MAISGVLGAPWASAAPRKSSRRVFVLVTDGLRPDEITADCTPHLHALRSAAHAPGALLPVPGADHFSILDGFRRPDGLLVRAAQDLLGGAR